MNAQTAASSPVPRLLSTPLQCVISGCSIALTIFLCIFLWAWTRASQSTIEAENSIKAATDGFAEIKTEIMRKCTPIKGAQLTVENAKDCGLLDHAAIVLDTLRGTLGQFEVALKREKRAADDLHNTQVEMATAVTKFGDAGEKAGNAAKQAGDLAAELKKTAEQINDPDNGVGAVMANANGSISDLRAELKSQAMQSFAADIRDVAHNTADATFHIAGVTKDLHTETSKMVAPKTKTQKALGWLPTGLRLGAVVACLSTGTPCP